MIKAWLCKHWVCPVPSIPSFPSSENLYSFKKKNEQSNNLSYFIELFYFSRILVHGGHFLSTKESHKRMMKILRECYDSPVKERLASLAAAPFVEVAMQIMAITMSWINLHHNKEKNWNYSSKFLAAKRTKSKFQLKNDHFLGTLKITIFLLLNLSKSLIKHLSLN